MTHETDKAWMEQAIKLAMSKGKSPEDTPIAAIVVLDGKILARAINQTEELCDATAHAEMMAFRKAGKVHGDMDLRGPLSIPPYSRVGCARWHLSGQRSDALSTARGGTMYTVCISKIVISIR